MADKSVATFNADSAKQVLGTVTAIAAEIERLIAAAGVGGAFNAPQVEQLTLLFGNLAGVVIQAAHDARAKQITEASVLELMPAKTELVEAKEAD